MISSKKNHELIRQNEPSVTKSQKHDVNLQKNSTLYFQIGLILCLLVTYGLFQMTFETKDYASETLKNLPDDDLYVYNEPFKIYEDQTTEPQRKKPPVVFKDPDIRKNDDPDVIETPDIFTKPPTTDSLAPKIEDIKYVEKPQPPMNVMVVEKVPVFPGCEKAKNNDERRQCMSTKMSKFIQKRFDTDLAPSLGLSGVQRINVIFKIDKNGNVVDIKSRAPHPELEREANRVIEKLPQMIPGQHGNQKVEVLYSIPIRFEVQN